MRKPSKDTIIKRFQVITDSREQTPYRFPNAVHRALPAGDYSIIYEGKSYEDKIIAERKSGISEIYSATGKERDRFERELVKLSKIDIRFVLCEFSFMDLVNYPPPGKLEASAVYGSIAKWQAVFGVPFLFLHNRANSRNFLWKVFYKYTEHKVLNY